MPCFSTFCINIRVKIFEKQKKTTTFFVYAMTNVNGAFQSHDLFMFSQLWKKLDFWSPDTHPAQSTNDFP